MDILSALEHKFPSFSKGQRTIAQFILKNYDKAAFMTAARLGEVTGVSESTVVRFAADLGYRGYPGMKKALQEIVRNRLTSVERIEAAESTMDGHDVLKAVLRADINNLQATLDEVDQDNFDQAVDMILSAKHIYMSRSSRRSPRARCTNRCCASARATSSSASATRAIPSARSAP